MRAQCRVVVAFVAVAGSVAALDAAGFELRPGVVAGPAGETLYVMRPEGGLAALSVASGRELFSTDAAARPLYADDAVLVAQVETPGRYGMLQLAVFDLRAPAATPATASIEMPAETEARVVATRNATFDVWATRSGEAVLVGWTYTRFEKTAVESAALNAAARRSASGALRMPLGRGPVRAIEPAEAPDPKRSPLPPGDVPALEGFAAEMAAQALGGGVRATGAGYALVELPGRDPRQPARVRRWAAGGTALGTIELFGDGRLVKNLSADGRHLLGSARVEGATAFPSYAWTVVDLASGQPVAAFRQADPAAAFYVTDERIVVDAAPRGRRVGDAWVWQPLTVQGLDRASGAMVWSRAVRDTTYAGDQPPAGP